MDANLLKYRNIDELQAQSSVPRETLQKYSKLSCETVYDSFKKLLEKAESSRGDHEAQYTFFMKAGELANLIRTNEKFSEFKEKNAKGVLFYSQYKDLLTKLSDLQTLLNKKYDMAKFREDKFERVQSVDAKDEFKENLGPVFPKLTISPKELVRMVSQNTPRKSAIVFDYRKEKTDQIFYQNELITVISIPNELLEPNLILTHLRNKLAIGQRALLSRINTVDYVVLMEEQSAPLEKGEPPPGTRASILFKALHEYSNDLRPKQRPLFMEGGFKMWRSQYPMYTKNENSSAKSAKPRDGLDDLVAAYHRDNTVASISYPDIGGVPQTRAKSPQTPQGPIGNVTVFPSHQRPVEQKSGLTMKTETTFGPNGIDTTRFAARGGITLNSFDSMKIGDPEESSFFSGKNGSHTPSLQMFSPQAATPSQNGQPIPSQTFDRANKPSGVDTRPATHGVPFPSTLSSSQDTSRKGVVSKGPSPIPPVSQLPNMPPVIATNGTHFQNISQNIPAPVIPARPKLPDRTMKPSMITAEREKALLTIYEEMSKALNSSGSKRGSPVPGWTGLYNMGNTCFMSATLQCLFHTPQLSDVFTRENFMAKVNPQNRMGTKGVISAVFSSLMDIVWSGQFSAIRPQRFLNLFADEVNASLADGQQHDASEFQIFLLDALHEDTNAVINRVSFEQNYRGGDHILKDANDFGIKSQKFSYSPVNKIFNLQTVSELRCTTCGESSATFEESSLVSVELLGNDRPCSLADCLRSHFSETRLDGDCRWNCPKCKQARPAVRRTHLWSLPPVLVIHLKRFSLSNGEYVKNTAAVAFEKSNFRPSEYFHPAAPRTNSAGSYRLYAVTNHSGRLNSGHYTATASHLRSGKWLRFDDESVTQTDIHSIDTKAAYILFYKRE